MTIHGEIQFYEAINAWRSEPPYLNFIPDSQHLTNNQENIGVFSVSNQS